ncbi:flagellin N-terminal helical domain-containing protein [Thiomicrorhabdus cannonii]|uniref:flagellin N-terminal helical domain-containing protein n=1 Tax=Thiomicrorhabdus cannonii TaxID=2748011 RepID=UPI0015BA75FB|nr:flagellin [Thiomicrorhabdus cannonii]
MAIQSYGSITSNSYIPNVTPSSSLATGSRINQAADDPAGLAVTASLTTQVNAQDMAVQNANNGIALLQTADGGSQSITQSVLRMNELALQAQNGTLSDQQRSMLNVEFQQNLENINNIANNTSYNGINLLNADTSNVNIALNDSNNALNLPNFTTDSLGLSGLDISNSANAALALQGLSTATEQLSNGRAQFGAQQNGLISSVNNLNSQNVNTLASRSTISDADMARVATEQTRQSILNEASMAMQAQGNQSRASVLQLLGS